jgi:hypothetical protein
LIVEMASRQSVSDLDSTFGAGCLGDVVESLLLGRIADGGYDSGICTTEVLFQQRQTETLVGAGDENGVWHVGLSGSEEVI